MQELAIIKQQWSGDGVAGYIVREKDQPLTSIPGVRSAGAGGQLTLPETTEFRRLLKSNLLLVVAELTSHTLEHACPREIQRRTSQPEARCVILLGRRGEVFTSLSPPCHIAGRNQLID